MKLQVISLAAKLAVLCLDNNTLILLTRYVFSMARYDRDYDVRDRARMLGSLLAGVIPALQFLSAAGDEGQGADAQNSERGGVILRREQVRVIMFEGKSIVQEEFASSGMSAPCTSVIRV